MKKHRQECDKSCFMCRFCIPEWIVAIDTKSIVKHYRKGQLIFEEGQKVEGMYFVMSGVVKLHKKWGEDKELIIRIFAKGDIVGQRGLGAKDIYPASATALEHVSVCYIDMDFFEASLKVNPAFLYHLMMSFATELQISEKHMRDLAHMTVKGRLAQALLVLKNKFGVDERGGIRINLSRQDLASYIGTTYETVFRTINELSEEGIVKTTGKHLAITNELRLAELVKEHSS